MSHASRKSNESSGGSLGSTGPTNAARGLATESIASEGEVPFALIMVALDGSPFAARALPLATALARRAGKPARIELVHVHDPGVYAANAPALDPGLENERAAEMNVDLQGVATKLAEEANLHVTAVTLRGRVAQSIALHAAERGADLLVMTTHGRSGIKRALLGSVTEQVLRTTSLPVLVVPSVEQDPPDEQ